MLRFRVLLCWCLLGACVTSAAAQTEEGNPLNLFGYFQGSFRYDNNLRSDSQNVKSFNAQQLNVFLQKDVTRKWTTFVNLEVINSFSSSRGWGGMSLEEAWVRYRATGQFNLKLGLQIPIFNNLNEIKNRTPLLPYIIRPIVYESSFNEIFELEAFVPARAYVQVYGILPLGAVKGDYAFYLGNSPNINDRRERGQTGVDTSATFLVGTRLGLRTEALKAGVSATRDYTNELIFLRAYTSEEPEDFADVPRQRLGTDLSVHLGRFALEGETIFVWYEDGSSDASLRRDFHYATVGFDVNEELFVYGSYWYSKLRGEAPDLFADTQLKIPNVGASYTLHEQITLKAQYARVYLDEREVDGLNELDLTQEAKANVFSVAVSVLF